MTRLAGTGSQEVAGGVSAHFCLVKTPLIAIWAKNIFWGGVGWGGVASFGIAGAVLDLFLSPMVGKEPESDCT